MACTLQNEEDVVFDYEKVNIEQEILDILLPHKQILLTILVTPSKVVKTECPALAYLASSTIYFSKPIEVAYKKNNIVPFTGDLSPREIAMVNGFIYRHLQPAASNRDKWFQKATVAHAITLLILFRKYKNSVSTDSEEFKELLIQAWELQTRSVPARKGIDVDRETILLLEKRMFETSKAAGPASYQQWGLDAGDHQDKWSPYVHIPEDWNYLDYDEHI